MESPVYIDSDKELERLAKRLTSHTAIAVDTEANPLFAYQERLCLVQISTGTRDYLIDPVAGVNVGLLSGVFADPVEAMVGRSERDVVESLTTATLRSCDNNRTKAAEMLGIGVRTLFNRLRSKEASVI